MRDELRPGYIVEFKLSLYRVNEYWCFAKIGAFQHFCVHLGDGKVIHFSAIDKGNRKDERDEFLVTNPSRCL